jgi:hypothetical protein
LSVSNIHDGERALQEREKLSGGKTCAYQQKLWKKVEIRAPGLPLH